MVMKKFCVLLFCLSLTACNQHEGKKGMDHELSSTSEVRSVDSEYNEYINHALGVSIKVPKAVLADGPYLQDQANPAVPVRIIEQGEIITFSRPSYPAWHYANTASGALTVPEDLSPRQPYYLPAYLDIPGYPYQMYIARADTIDDVKALVKRAYGAGCMVDDARSSTYEDRAGLMTFTLGPNEQECASYTTVGDSVLWYRNEHVAIGYQPMAIGNFTKPYFLVPYGNVSTLYDFPVTVVPK